MAYNVRVYTYAGLKQIPNDKPEQFSSDSVQQLEQPYLSAEVISCSAVAAAMTTVSNARIKLLRIEVPDGQTIRYEINPPGRSVVAASVSPSLSGKDQFFFRTGWGLSIIDAADLA